MSFASETKSFFHLFPVPEYLLLATTGVAISDESVRFAQFRRGMMGQSLKVSGYGKAVLPEGVVQSGSINDQGKLGAALKELARRHSLRYVRATLPEEKAYLFSAVIEKVPAESLRDAVAFIIEENAPVSLSSSIFDFDIIEELKETNQLKVAVAVIAKSVIDLYVGAFESAGLVPVSFAIESQAIAQAIVPKGDRRTHLIVNLGAKKTGFYVVEDGVVQFTTTFQYGALPGSHINDLKTEMAKIFDFWSTRPVRPGFPERRIEKVLLAGPGAANAALVTELMSDCPVEHAVANAWTNVPEAAGHLPADLSAEALEYAPALGLALPDTDKIISELLTDEARAKVAQEYAFRRASIMVAAFIFVLIVATAGLFPSYILTKSRKLDVVRRMSALGDLGGEANEPVLQSWLSDLDLKLRFLDPKLDRDRPSQFIEQVLEERVPGIKVNNLSWSQAEGKPMLLVSGTALDRQALLSFEDRLNASGNFSEFSLPISNLAKDKDISFRLELRPKQTP